MKRGPTHGLTRKLLALTCGVLTVMLVSAELSPADARRGHGGGGGSYRFSGSGHGGGGSYRHFGGGSRDYSGHGHHRRYRGGIYLGVPSTYYYGSDYYYSDCSYLRRRAQRTGSPYWWDRYYACIGD